MAGPLTMTRQERETFLADVHVGVISIERVGGAPLAVPVWYDFAPDRGVWIVTDPTSQKGRALARARRFSLCAQIETPPAYRYVSVSGPVVDERPADLESDRRPMAHRYLGETLGDLFVESQEGDSHVYVMRPERWWTVDYGRLQLDG